MHNRVQLKIQTISLRMQGYTYREIRKEVPVSKSTISGWLKYIRLTPQQQTTLNERVSQIVVDARARALNTNRSRRESSVTEIKHKARALFDQFHMEHLFILGIGLYWGHGTKKGGFQFISADPEQIQVMLDWLRCYANVSRETFGLRVIGDEQHKEEAVSFWSILAGIVKTRVTYTAQTKSSNAGKYDRKRNQYGICRIELKRSSSMVKFMYELKLILISERKMLYSQGK